MSTEQNEQNKTAPNENRTHDLSLTKGTQYHCAIGACVLRL